MSEKCPGPSCGAEHSIQRAQTLSLSCPALNAGNSLTGCVTLDTSLTDLVGPTPHLCAMGILPAPIPGVVWRIQ